MADHNLNSADGPRYCDIGRHRGDWVVYVKGDIYLTPEEYAHYSSTASLNITVGQQQETIPPKICKTCDQQIVFDPVGRGLWSHKETRFDTHQAIPVKKTG